MTDDKWKTREEIRAPVAFHPLEPKKGEEKGKEKGASALSNHTLFIIKSHINLLCAKKIKNTEESEDNDEWWKRGSRGERKGCGGRDAVRWLS